MQLIAILFFGIPIAMVAFCISSIIRYTEAKKENKANPGSVSPEQMKKHKILMIVSSVTAGLLVAAVLAIIILLMMAIAFM